MIQNYPNKKKIDKVHENKHKDKDSGSKILEGDTKIEKKEKKSKKKNKDKSKKKKRGLKKLEEIEVKEAKITKFSLGDIKYAEMHKQATKPLRQLQDLTEEDLKICTCPCCGLPSQVTGKLEPYTICDNPDDFSNCGQGVALYYSFIKFVIYVTLVATIGISSVNIYYAYKYTYELRTVCNNYYHYDLVPNRNEKYVDECKFYFTEADENDPKYYALVDSFFFQFSLPNVKDYRELFKKMNPSKSDEFEGTIVNLSLTNFLILIIIFIANLIYIYFLFNKSNAADYLVFTVSDYAIFLTNLYDIYGKFNNILKLVRNKEEEKEAKKKKKKVDRSKYIKRLGFEPDEKMSQIDLFKKFLQEKIFKEKKDDKSVKDKSINRIDLCYKLGEMVEFQKNLDELEEKIQRIEFDPDINEKNKERQLEGEERNFYSNFLSIPCSCCENAESLKDIKKQKEKVENDMNELIKATKENTAEHFGGAAFITFNTIKQQELYLSKLPSNFFDYIIHYFKNMFYIFCSCCTKEDSLNYYKAHIAFEAAPEPEDVIFENLETKPFWRIINTFIVYLVSIIICGVSFIAIIFLNKLQENVNKDKENKANHTLLLYVISFGITGVTSAIDIVLEIVLEKLTKWEKQLTWTNFYLSYSLKLTLFSFLNSAVLPIVSEFFFNESNGYEFLISNMLMKFLVNSFVTTIMWTVNVGCVLKLLRQWFIERKETIHYNQKELNEIYELSPMNVAAKYSYIVKTLLMSFLYVPIFPLGLGISLLGFILGYWLEKYNFANRYKKPEMLNRQIVEFYSNYFVIILFVYGIGDYIFLHDVYETRTWSLVNIILFGVLIILPYNQLLSIDFLKFDESEIHEKEYDQKYVDFLNDYERANPMTKKEGEMRYLEQLEKKHKIDKKEAEKRKKKIKEENPMKFYRSQIKNQNIKGLNDMLINEADKKDYIINPIGKDEEDDKNRDISQLLDNDSNNHINGVSSLNQNSNVLMNQGQTSKNIFTNMK